MAIEYSLSSPKRSFGSIFFRFIPRPYTGRLWLDLLFLVVICALSLTVVPSMIGHYVLVDLITPWVVTTLVAAPLSHGALISLLAALILETRSTAPAGLYITSYWMIAAAIHLTRSSLSWSHAFPWAVTFCITQLWVVAFETFVMSVVIGSLGLTLDDLIVQVIRVVLAIGFGLIIAHRFMTLDPNEDLV